MLYINEGYPNCTAYKMLERVPACNLREDLNEKILGGVSERMREKSTRLRKGGNL